MNSYITLKIYICNHSFGCKSCTNSVDKRNVSYFSWAVFCPSVSKQQRTLPCDAYVINKSPRIPLTNTALLKHDDVIKWKHFPRYWPFVRGIHRSLVNSPHKGQWRGALMFTLICARINGWVNNREAGDLRRYRGHYDVTVMNSRMNT